MPLPYPLDPASDLALTFEDEYEVSSRSADSLDIDEAFLDTFTADEKLEALLEHQPVVLLSRVGREFDCDLDKTPVNDNGNGDMCARIQSAPVELVSEESDFEDFNPDLDRKPARGFYDIAMLTGFCPPGLAEQNQIDSEKQEGITSEIELNDDELSLLHPDMKLELAIADYRKRSRIAKFIKLHQMSRDEIKQYGAQLIQAESSDFYRGGGSHNREQNDLQETQKIPSKVRKDDFWIRPEPSTPNNSEATPTRAALTPNKMDSSPKLLLLEDNDMAGQCSSGFMQLEGACETESSTDAETADDLQFRPIHPMTLTQSKDDHHGMTSHQEPLISNLDTSSPILVPSVRTTLAEGQMGTPKSADSTPREMGIWQHYQKEAIPWSAGTVRRTKAEIEEKYSEPSVKPSTSSQDECLSKSMSSPDREAAVKTSASRKISAPGGIAGYHDVSVKSRDHMSLELNPSLNRDKQGLNPPSQSGSVFGASPRSIASKVFESPLSISTPESVFTSSPLSVADSNAGIKVVRVTGEKIKRKKSFTTLTYPTATDAKRIGSPVAQPPNGSKGGSGQSGGDVEGSSKQHTSRLSVTISSQGPSQSPQPALNDESIVAPPPLESKTSANPVSN